MKRTICKIPSDLVHLFKSDKIIINLFNRESFVPLQKLPEELKYFKYITNAETWGHASFNNTDKVFKASDSSFGMERSQFPAFVFPSLIRRSQLLEHGCEPMTIYEAGYPGFLENNGEPDAVTMHLPYFTPKSKSPHKRKRKWSKFIQTPSGSVSTSTKHSKARSPTSPPTPKRKRTTASCSCTLPKHEPTCSPTPKRSVGRPPLNRPGSASRPKPKLPASANRPTPKRPASASRPTPKKKILQKTNNSIAAQTQLLKGRECRVLLHRLKLHTDDDATRGENIKSPKIHRKISKTSPKPPKSRETPSPTTKSQKSPTQMLDSQHQLNIIEMAAAAAEIELTDIEVTDDETYSEIEISEYPVLHLVDEAISEDVDMKGESIAADEAKNPMIKIFVHGMLVNTASLDEFGI